VDPNNATPVQKSVFGASAAPKLELDAKISQNEILRTEVKYSFTLFLCSLLSVRRNYGRILNFGGMQLQLTTSEAFLEPVQPKN